jgi:hypothetical protein
VLNGNVQEFIDALQFAENTEKMARQNWPAGLTKGRPAEGPTLARPDTYGIGRESADLPKK